MLEHNKEIKKIIEHNLTEYTSKSEIESFISDLKKAGSYLISTMKIIVEKLLLTSKNRKIWFLFLQLGVFYILNRILFFNYAFLDIASEDADQIERKMERLFL